jgi:staphylococcal nuclease domain-containing protein 1
VTFRIDSESAGRAYGSVFLNDLDLAAACVAAGWASLSKSVGDPPPLLAEAQAQAQEKKLGVWAAQPLSVTSYKAADPATLLAPTTALVEAVLNGATLRFALPGSAQFVTGILAGVACPSMGRRPEAPGAAEAQPEPFAREAKHFSETQVLHRLVEMTPLGCDAYRNLVVNVRWEQGTSLAETLLRAGLARLTERTLVLAPSADAPKLRAAESAAVAERLGLWASMPPVAPSLVQRGRLAERVVEVVSGDVLVVADAATGAERRVCLASTRAPRLGNPRKGDPPQPFAMEARDFLRTHLVGRTVACEAEYARLVGGGEEEAAGRRMEFASLYEERADSRAPGGVARRSVAELLVAAGLALAQRHRPGDERATRYDALLAAEEAARAANRGLHSGVEPLVQASPHDISRDVGRARAFLSTLQRAGRTTAVVDYVLSAGRYKLHVIKENVLLLFALGGVRSPRPPDAGAEAALSYVRAHVTQRTVTVQIESLDAKGVFMGSLVIPSSPGAAPSVPLARALVEAGLAAAVGSHPHGLQLREAEIAARAARLGMWKDWDESASRADAAEPEVDEEQESLAVTVTEVRSAAAFFLQRRNDPDLARVQDALNPVEDVAADCEVQPAVGDLCRGRFSADDRWYRARVMAQLDDGACLVLFIDFGNEEALPSARLGLLDSELAAVPPLALCASLAFLTAPGLDDEYGEEAAFLLARLTGGGRPFLARVEARNKAAAPGTPSLFVTLREEGAPPGSLSVGASLLREGLAKLVRGTSARSRLAAHALSEHEAHARTFRRGLFEGGGYESEDD